MKKLIPILLMCLLVFSSTGCYILRPASLLPVSQPKKKDKNGLSRSTFPDLHPDKENILLTTMVSKEYYKKGNTTPSDMEVSRLNYVFNVKTKKTEKFFPQFPGILNFSLENTDEFDWNNFLSDYQPEGKDYYEIGRFIPAKNQYTPIITNNQTANAILIKVFTKQNLVFYYKAKRKPEYQDLWVMNLDGTNQRNITNGNYVMVSNCVLLDNERVYIDGGYEKADTPFDMIYYPKQNKAKMLYNDKKQWSRFWGIYQNQMVMEIEEEGQENKLEFSLFDFDGNKKRQICEIPDFYVWKDRLFDEKLGRIFFAYKSTNEKDKIVVINVSDSKIKEVFSKASIYYDIHLNLNQAENFIYFRQEERKEINGKLEQIDTFHRIDLDTTIDDSFILPDFTENCFSSDGNYIFSYNTWGYPKYNAIIDCKTKKVTKLNQSLRLGHIFPFYCPTTKQFCFCIDSDDPQEIYFVDLDGKVTKYPLWK